jgi:dTDP-4-amino-4,6-dideoxygalactose transaminase
MNFRDLKAQYLALKPDIDKAMIDTAMRGDFISGQAVTELEEKLANYVGAKHCISCANGTDALTLALKVWNIGPGDAVFVPDFTFIATAEVISLEGATPVFVDVEPRTFNICKVSLEKAIQKIQYEGILKPRVIIPVNLFGLPASYPEIKKIAKIHKLFILEDSAQGFGGSINGKMACSFGDISTTSFFPAKPLGCYGDGGAVFTDNDDWADQMNSIKVHGKGSDKYDNVRVGLNSRLDTLQAAILIPKLEAFRTYELKKVNEAAENYTQKLASHFMTPYIPEGYYSSWAQYTLILDSQVQRDQLQQYLKENGIPSMVYYPKPLHAQTAYKHLGYKSEDNPVSHQLSKTVLSLPMHPYLSVNNITYITETLMRYKYL